MANSTGASSLLGWSEHAHHTMMFEASRAPRRCELRRLARALPRPVDAMHLVTPVRASAPACRWTHSFQSDGRFEAAAPPGGRRGRRPDWPSDGAPRGAGPALVGCSSLLLGTWPHASGCAIVGCTPASLAGHGRGEAGRDGVEHGRPAGQRGPAAARRPGLVGVSPVGGLLISRLTVLAPGRALGGLDEPACASRPASFASTVAACASWPPTRAV
jgi:hypothetical protein